MITNWGLVRLVRITKEGCQPQYSSIPQRTHTEEHTYWPTDYPFSHQEILHLYNFMKTSQLTIFYIFMKILTIETLFATLMRGYDHGSAAQFWCFCIKCSSLDLFLCSNVYVLMYERSCVQVFICSCVQVFIFSCVQVFILS